VVDRAPSAGLAASFVVRRRMGREPAGFGVKLVPQLLRDVLFFLRGTACSALLFVSVPGTVPAYGLYPQCLNSMRWRASGKNTKSPSLGRSTNGQRSGRLLDRPADRVIRVGIWICAGRAGRVLPTFIYRCCLPCNFAWPRTVRLVVPEKSLRRRPGPVPPSDDERLMASSVVSFAFFFPTNGR